MRKNGFTLVELIVSIALVLILMLGVSTVFKTTSRTVASGQAISENTRVARAAQSVLARDMDSMVTTSDAPFLIIKSSRISAFLNRQDDLGDGQTVQFKSAHELTIDLNGNNIEGEAAAVMAGERISAAKYNHRSHRTDIISFFARGLFNRGTGNPGQNFISPMTRAESFISFGHLQVWDGIGSPYTAGAFQPPGNSGTLTYTTNPHNYYASQFVLGRSQILLSEGQDTGGDGYPDIISDGTQNQRFWHRPEGAAASNLSPLAQGSGIDTGTLLVQQATVDIAGVTMAQMRDLVGNYIANIPPNNADWYSRFAFRFCGNPFMPKPLTSETLAQTASAFIPSCSQFIVEYAGDFLNQDATTGAVIDTYANTTGATPLILPTDNKIDFVQIGTGATMQRQIRWYGMPRDTTGDGATTLGVASPDVLPLRDYWQLVAREFASAAPFEKKMDVASTPTLPKKVNYLDTGGAAGNLGMGVNDIYTCAFGPNDPKPKMIRITIVLDDPGNRLQSTDGQTFEYVFSLP